MIPPMQDLRIRSITKWLKDNRPDFGMLPHEAQLQTATDLDESMIEAFEEQDDALMQRLMKAKTWGTEPGLQQYTTDRMAIWQDVCSEFLPTSDPG